MTLGERPAHWQWEKDPLQSISKSAKQTKRSRKMASPQITAHTEWCGEPFVQLEFFYFAHVYGNWPELVLVPPPPSSGQRALLNTPKTGKNVTLSGIGLSWSIAGEISLISSLPGRKAIQQDSISPRKRRFHQDLFDLCFQFSLDPRPPGKCPPPETREKTSACILSPWTEFSRIKSDKHGWTTKKIKPHSDCDIQGHAYCLFLKIWVSGAEL